jgi:molybdopterin-containing oxidoreductase family iron-sulfur binding subunit
VAYVEPVARSTYAHGDAVAELAAAMHADQVDTLVMLDTNPVYSAPPELAFAQALRQVPCSVHLGLYRDETARAATWHLPLAHNYEAWSDARAHDGTATIVQPMIAPLYGGRSAHAVLAMVQGIGQDGGRESAPEMGPGTAQAARDGHALVRATWQARQAAHGGQEGLAAREMQAEQEGQAGQAGPAGWAGRQPQPPSAFDTFWRESLRSGIVPGSAAPIVAVRRVSPVARPAASAAAPLVVTFAPDPAVDDGGFSNNAWLQELPRPLTSLTWDNAALVGPATAARAGLADGDVARLTVDGRVVQAPVLVLPEQAEGVVTLPLGYGRSSAGAVGNAVGFDAYRLRSRAAMAGPLPLQLARTGRRHTFALRQREVDMHGRELVRTEAPGAERPAREARTSLYPERRYDGYKWGMAIDLNACIGCGACTVACQAENNIPVVGKEDVIKGRSMHWIRVDRYRDGPRTLFQPVPCMHCEHAPCEEVCPVGATVHDSEGLNVQVYNRCIGTRFCSNNCPYKVRRFNFLQYADQRHDSLKAQRNPEVTVRRRGVMEKCTYCLQRVTRARIEAEKQGRRIADGEVVTACQAVCPTSAIHFGDLNDPHSDVVAAKASPLDYALLDELNTRPRTTYTARVIPPDAEPA